MKNENQKKLNKDSDEFGTPQWLFDALNKEFHFTVDAFASEANAKLPYYWTKGTDGFTQSWAGHRVFANPPYSRGNVKRCFFKALHECRLQEAGNAICTIAVLLIPTYTERDWYHEYRSEFEVRPILGRVQFEGGESGARGNHMILVFRSSELAWWSPS